MKKNIHTLVLDERDYNTPLDRLGKEALFWWDCLNKRGKANAISGNLSTSKNEHIRFEHIRTAYLNVHLIDAS